MNYISKLLIFFLIIFSNFSNALELQTKEEIKSALTLYHSEPLGKGYGSGTDLFEYAILHSLVPSNLKAKLMPWISDGKIQKNLLPIITTAYMVGVVEAKTDPTISISPNCNGVKGVLTIINLIEMRISEKMPLAKESVNKSGQYSGCNPT